MPDTFIPREWAEGIVLMADSCISEGDYYHEDVLHWIAENYPDFADDIKRMLKNAWRT